VIRLVIDVNLSPVWVEFLANHGWLAVHWSTVGDSRARGRTVTTWAREHGHVVFTHDLDFGTLLALTRETGPSVFKFAPMIVFTEQIGLIVVATIRTYESQRRRGPCPARRMRLHEGAIVTVDELRGRVRILPIHSKSK
jgi:predicted nuclease of predicted toxin-antitoxin system